MCNLGEGLVLQVTEEVQIDSWVQCAIGVMKNFGVNAEKAMDAFGVPEDKREIVLARIDEQLIPAS